MAPKKAKGGKGSAGSKKKGKGGKKGSATQEKPGSPTDQEKPKHPEDIFPMVLTSATQELLGCRADEDVTKDEPFKLLKKDDIMQDIRTRAAVSDFSPVKQTVLDYPEESILLVYDYDFKYDQSFYLVLTPEAKDRILNPPEPEAVGEEGKDGKEGKDEAQEEEFDDKPPEPKPWVSLGSELEIDQESVTEKSQKLRYEFSRVRRKFGLPVSFSDRNAAGVRDGFQKCPSHKDSRFSIKKLQRDCGIQAVLDLQSSGAQTLWKFRRNVFTHYEPRRFEQEEEESVLQSDGLKTFCSSVLNSVLHALQQEDIMNKCIDDWKALETAEASDWSLKAPDGLAFYLAFSDQKYSKGKKISVVNWHPAIPGVIAVALTALRDEEQENCSTFDVQHAFIVFYCFSDPNCPQVLLECPDDVLTFDFCPSDPHLVVGGCRNGQVVLWDISSQVNRLEEAQTSGKKAPVNNDAADVKEVQKKTPIVCYSAVSVLESSHKAAVLDVKWLPQTYEMTKTGVPVVNKSNTCVQVISCSPDCTVLFWDVRTPNPVAADNLKHLNQTWKPLLRMAVRRIETRGDFPPLKILMDADDPAETESKTEKPTEGENPEAAKTVTAAEDVKTTFYMGTEDGEVLYADWKQMQEDSGRFYSTKPQFSFRVHHGLVNTLQRSPFFKDIILTVGGTNFAIWKEEVTDGPIMVSPSCEQECTAGCWSPSRPAVFFIGTESGSIEVWNLLNDTGAPSQVYPYVTHVRIACIEPWIISPKQHVLAVIDLGMVRVFEIPRALRTPTKRESVNVNKYFEFETDRLMDCLKRKESWEKRKRGGGDSKEDAEAEMPAETLPDTEEGNMKEHSDFMALRDDVLKAAGLQRETAADDLDDDL
ncbi:unnamed protein product [Ophioblennius macclurei]